jgi:MFS family permease
MWVADFVSNLGTFAQSIGAGWLMTSLTTSPLLVSLVQTAASLPLFLTAIPAGVYADLVDRRRLIRNTNALLVVLVAALATATFLGWVTPLVLLGATFAISLVSAIAEPAWGALVPEVVSENDLPSAIALNGINFNLSRVVSPPLAGLLVAAAGPAIAFAINAISFIPTVAIMRPTGTSKNPSVRALSAGTAATLAFARSCGALRDVLFRNAGFGVCSSIIFALLPLYVRIELHGNAMQFGLLSGALGAGSVLVAQVIAPLRTRLGVSNAVLVGTALLGLCMIALGVNHSVALGIGVLFVAGFGWLTVLSTLNTSIQFAVSKEHRAAGFALYLVTSQGVQAAGAFFWGWFAAQFGCGSAFIAVGVLFIVLGFATWRVPLPWSGVTRAA